eukprot:4737985-Amphidinium_carterae.1
MSPWDSYKLDCPEKCPSDFQCFGSWHPSSHVSVFGGAVLANGPCHMCQAQAQSKSCLNWGVLLFSSASFRASLPLQANQIDQLG